MAIYHCSVKIISRSQGRSATGAAAYRSGEKILDERTGIVHDYTRKNGIDHSEIIAPENSPQWAHNRSQLWNQVEHKEKRKDAQLCREIEVALPCELDHEQNKILVREFAQSEFVHKGMIADIAFHHADGENPHAHILLTTRTITPEGFDQKNRSWNAKALLETWRESWQEHTNTALERAGHDSRIDHRTLEAQGIERLPQIHLGPKVIEMEKRGIQTERGERALDIDQINTQIIDLKDYRKALEHECNIELEKSTDTRAAGKPDRTYSAGIGELGRSGHSPDSTADRSGRSAYSGLDQNPDHYSQSVGRSRQEPERGSARAGRSDQPDTETQQDMAEQSISHLSGEFTHAYGGAYDRIMDLARPTDSDQGRDHMAGTPDKQLDRTYLAVRRQLQAIGAKLYEIGVKTAKGMLSREWSINQVLQSIPWLKRENAKGADIYVRPAGEQNQGVLLVDDLNLAKIQRMKDSGYEPAAVVETSPANYQAWIRLTDQEINPQLATAISKGLARHFQGDPNSADWRHFGRLAGFTNRKPEHTTAKGMNPWVLCHESSGKQASKGEETIRVISERITNHHMTDNRETRLNKAIEAREGHTNNNLIENYRKNFKALYGRYGADMDLSRADSMICKSMAKTGATPEQLIKTLEEASPELSTRKANHEQDYCQRTVQAAFEDREVALYLKLTAEQQAKKSRSKGYSR